MLEGGALLTDKGVVNVFYCLRIHYNYPFFTLVHYFLKSILHYILRFEFTTLYIGELSDKTCHEEEINDKEEIVSVKFGEAVGVGDDCHVERAHDDKNKH